MEAFLLRIPVRRQLFADRSKTLGSSRGHWSSGIGTGGEAVIEIRRGVEVERSRAENAWPKALGFPLGAGHSRIGEPRRSGH